MSSPCLLITEQQSFVCLVVVRRVIIFACERHEFLRDGDQLAARMTGTIKVEGVDMEFESFMFAKVDSGSGKLECLVERSVWGPVGGEAVQGA